MRVRLKVGIYTLLTTVVAVGVLYLTLGYALKSQFAQLELFTSKRDASRAVEALGAEEERISETALDYAAWDDSYNFVNAPTQEFIDSNFAHSTLKYDVILYISSTGTIVYSMTSNLETDKAFTLPASFRNELQDPRSIYHFTSASSSRQGIVMTTAGPLLFAALPITKSDRKSDIRGTIVMGRIIDPVELGRLSDLIKIPMTTVLLDSKEASIFPQDWKGSLMPTETVFEVPISADRMHVYALVPDVKGRPAFAIRADLPRLTNIEGQRGLQYLLLALIAMSVVFATFSIISIDRLVVHPIQRLSEAVRTMEETRTMPDRFVFQHDDEIADLSRTFARAFGALELTENRLRMDRERLDAILQSIGEGVVVVGRDRNIVLANRTSETLSRYTAAEVVGQPYERFFVFYNERDRAERIDVIGNVLDANGSMSTTVPLIYQRKDGATVPVACVSAALRDISGHSIGCVLVFRDVTHEREVDRMKSELVSIASHQLRTPLTGIKWVLELMLNTKEGRLTHNQREQLQQVVESNERMMALVEDLLNVSHIETGRKFSFSFHRQDLMKIVRSVVAENQVLAEPKKIKLTISDDSPRVCPAVVDADKIREAITNLVSNAVKYTPHGGKVTVAVSQTSLGEVLLHVKDNGIGIPVEQQKRVFERFFRADNAQHQEVNGTGLGLYIAKAIVEGHRGRLWFESIENKGSTFSFLLPPHEERDMEPTNVDVKPVA